MQHNVMCALSRLASGSAAARAGAAAAAVPVTNSMSSDSFWNRFCLDAIFIRPFRFTRCLRVGPSSSPSSASSISGSFSGATSRTIIMSVADLVQEARAVRTRRVALGGHVAPVARARHGGPRVLGTVPVPDRYRYRRASEVRSPDPAPGGTPGRAPRRIFPCCNPRARASCAHCTLGCPRTCALARAHR